MVLSMVFVEHSGNFHYFSLVQTREVAIFHKMFNKIHRKNHEQKSKILKSKFYATANLLKVMLMKYRVSSDSAAIRENSHKIFALFGQNSLVLHVCGLSTDTDFPRFSGIFGFAMVFGLLVIRAHGELEARETCVVKPLS